MTVLAPGVSVIVRVQAIHYRYPGGWQASSGRHLTIRYIVTTEHHGTPFGPLQHETDNAARANSLWLAHLSPPQNQVLEDRLR